MQFSGEVKALHPACTALERSALAAALSQRIDQI